MSLFGTVKEEIEKLFDSDDIKKDNVVNKLHYKITALTLAATSIVMSMQQVCILLSK